MEYYVYLKRVLRIFLLISIGNLNLLSIKKTWAKTIVETIRKPPSNDIAKINLYLGIYTQGLY